MDGVLVVDKPAGMTSHDVVARVRRWLRTRKVGHAGTLDPMATGVLVLGVGRATRLLGHLAGADKAYTATMRLGQSSTSDDADGTVTDVAPADRLDREAVRAAAEHYVGDIEQRPSDVSAIKIDGVRAHALVRSGLPVDLPGRPVRISRFDVQAVRPGPGRTLDVDIEVDCSTGTYVRALARDVGADLGVGGHLVALRRTRSGPFGAAGAVRLPEPGTVAAPPPLIPLAAAAARSFPRVRVAADQARPVSHGVRIDLPADADPALDRDRVFVLVDPDGEALALATAPAGTCRYALVLGAGRLGP